ncbi:hypothetical protein [uncultured Gimesia sp.]|uniref:hypothetical protein n=1 Tax=uncultured Gimesia sp. TaxID=1678688 RepID=UPI002628D166|nr:hypothetical protein [uncultured Gimesia sp.]
MNQSISDQPPQQPISWERVRAIFDYPEPPENVWQRQFDGFDEELQELARTSYEQIDFSDMWYYHHDLAYVKLQPELFAYLFPVCLMDWHQTLQNNEPCSHGDSEFHYGISNGNVFENMLTPKQLTEVTLFFRDSFLERLDSEREIPQLQKGFPSLGWLGRFNSLGVIVPNIEPIWNAWWTVKTPGRAITAIQYCSSLMYFEGENPLFEECHGTGLCLCENDSLFDAFWSDKNIQFLSATLTVDFVNQKVADAIARLRKESNLKYAQQLEDDLPERQEVIALQIDDLLTQL